MTAELWCPVSMYNEWAPSTLCGKPVKRNGKCGIHAAVEERRVANDAAREAKYAERKQKSAQASTLLGVPVEFYEGKYYIYEHNFDAWVRKQP